MTSLIKLELRKSRPLFLALALGCAVSCLAGLAWPKIPMDEALRTVLIMWSLLGFPAAALVLGAGGGAQMRGRDVSEAEALLPVSHSARLLASLAGSALWLLPFAMLALLANRSAEVLLTGASLFLCSFAASYIFANAAAGAVLSAAISFPLWYLLWHAEIITWLVTITYTLGSPVKLPALVASFACPVIVLVLAGSRLERGRALGLTRALASGVLLLAPLAISGASFFHSAHRAADEAFLFPIESCGEAGAWSAELVGIAPNGEVSFVDRAGKRKTAMKKRYSLPLNLLDFAGFMPPVLPLKIMADGHSGLWVIADDRRLFNASTADSELRELLPLSRQLMARGPGKYHTLECAGSAVRVAEYSHARTRGQSAVLPPENGGNLNWRPQEASKARQKYDEVSAKRAGWRIPSHKMLFWTVSGGALVAQGGGLVSVISPDGRYLPQFNLMPLVREALSKDDELLSIPLRWSDGHVWFGVDAWVLEVDPATGKLVNKFRIPKEKSGARPRYLTQFWGINDDGFFMESDRGRVYSVDWNGKTRMIGYHSGRQLENVF